MTNVLSQDEVDSLLGGISEGKVQTETDIPEKEEDVKVFDFQVKSGPGHLSLPVLGMINERFIGFLRTSLSKATRAIVDVNLSSTETLEYGEFCRSLPLPTTLNIFKMEPLRGFALVVLEGPLVFSFVDTFFGGKGVSHVKLEGRGFTTIERKIIERVTKVILGDLQQAWADVHKLSMIFMRTEMDPQFVTIVTPSEMVIVSKLTVELENESGTISLCIPYSTIEPVREMLRHSFQGEKIEVDVTWKRYMERKLREVTVDMRCTLGVAKVNGKELLEMKIDDVIRMDQKVGDPVAISVEGVPKFKGFIGSCNKMKAVRVCEIIDKE